MANYERFRFSEDFSKELLNDVDENCNKVQELAMTVIGSQHIPLLNSMLCLSKDDCRVILDRYIKRSQNDFEHSLLLILLTDFISCVSANSESFPLALKKNERKGIISLLQMLQTKWCQLFSNLNSGGITSSQMMNILKIVKRCLERMPDQNYKMFMEIILKMADKALDKLLKQTIVNNTHFESERNLQKSLKSTFEPDLKNSGRINEREGKENNDKSKFVLKSCENVKNMGPSGHEENIHKRKQHDPELPPLKKLCMHDDFINGKVNAFKILMKPCKKKLLSKR